MDQLYINDLICLSIPQMPDRGISPLVPMMWGVRRDKEWFYQVIKCALSSENRKKGS